METASPDQGDRQRWPSSPRVLTWLLRTIGVLDLLAFAAVVMPRSMMIAVHAQLQLGALPTEPIVGYLARTASMFYGFCGVLLLYLAADVVRHRDTIRFVAGCGMAAGVLIVLIDVAEGMPLWWIAMEGPCCGLLAALIGRLARS